MKKTAHRYPSYMDPLAELLAGNPALFFKASSRAEIELWDGEAEPLLNALTETHLRLALVLHGPESNDYFDALSVKARKSTPGTAGHAEAWKELIALSRKGLKGTHWNWALTELLCMQGRDALEAQRPAEALALFREAFDLYMKEPDGHDSLSVASDHLKYDYPRLLEAEGKQIEAAGVRALVEQKEKGGGA